MSAAIITATHTRQNIRTAEGQPHSAHGRHTAQPATAQAHTQRETYTQHTDTHKEASTQRDTQHRHNNTRRHTHTTQRQREYVLQVHVASEQTFY